MGIFSIFYLKNLRKTCNLLEPVSYSYISLCHYISVPFISQHPSLSSLCWITSPIHNKFLPFSPSSKRRLVDTIQISAELTFTITLTHFCGLCLCMYPQPIFFPRPRYFLFCKDNMLWLSGHLLGPTVLANNLRPKLISSFGPLTAHLDNWRNRIYNVSLSSKVFTALSKTKIKQRF